jgi:hypothetical protein
MAARRTRELALHSKGLCAPLPKCHAVSKCRRRALLSTTLFFARDDLGYRRPLVAAACDGLRRRGLPEVLLVHSWLPEGVTVCAVRVFAAMIEEAYHTPGALLMNPPDEDVAPAPAGPAAGRGHRCSVRRHDDTGRRRKDERDQTGAATTGTGMAVDLQLVRRGPMTGRR